MDRQDDLQTLPPRLDQETISSTHKSVGRVRFRA
jgi:hypothetical protein